MEQPDLATRNALCTLRDPLRVALLPAFRRIRLHPAARCARRAVRTEESRCHLIHRIMCNGKHLDASCSVVP